MDLTGKRGTGDQGCAAGGAGEDVVLAGQAQIIGLPGEKHWPLHGGLVVGGPSKRQDSAFGMSWFVPRIFLEKVKLRLLS